MFKKGDLVEVISADGGWSISVGQRYRLVKDEIEGLVYIDPAYQYYRSERFKLANASPIRTETVTTRHIEPGVYGLLHIDTYKDQMVLTIDPTVGHQPSASSLRELARVALELAEYLDAE